MLRETADEFIVVCAGEGDVIHAAAAVINRVRRVGGGAGRLVVARALADVDAGHVARVDPETLELERWPWPQAQPQYVAVKTARLLEVFRQHHEVLHVSDGHFAELNPLVVFVWDRRAPMVACPR